MTGPRHDAAAFVTPNRKRAKTRMYTTVVGCPVAELDTPALVLDLDAFEHNLATMAADIAARGVSWRPHAKAHKSPAVAHRQIAAGAIGVTCAKVSEAEVFAANGIRDILIANEVVGPIKTRRLAAVCRQADVIVAVDSADNVREHDRAAAAAGSKPRVVIEVNVGMERAGVLPGAPAVELAKLVASMPNLRFAGVMAWEGHTMAMQGGDERVAEINAAVNRLLETAQACRDAGLTVDIVSAGGTGTYLTTVGIAGVTEVQAGGGVFGDVVYRRLGVNVKPALSVLATVTSRPTATRVIIDAGRKTIDPSSRQPDILELPEVEKMGFSAEHGTLHLPAPSDTPRVADRLTLQSGYSDQLCHLHEHIYGVRDGLVETVWPVAGRGRLQ